MAFSGPAGPPDDDHAGVPQQQTGPGVPGPQQPPVAPPAHGQQHPAYGQLPGHDQQPPPYGGAYPLSYAAPSGVMTASDERTWGTLSHVAPFVGGIVGLPFLGALVVFLIAFALTALGFAIAWRMDSTAAFHGIINLFLIPIWLLSGSVFPLSGASGWIRVLMEINPLTYGTDALRSLLYPNVSATFSLPYSVGILALFSLIMFGLAFVMATRRGTKPAA